MSNSLSTKLPETKQPLASNIYKVKLFANGTINTIFVFTGKRSEETETELFGKIFSEHETEQIKTDKITVKFSEQQIHFDDSIGTIKLKILNELKRDISLDEIYLYCQKIETLNAVSVYESLTQNSKLPLTQVRLDQFISNIVSDEKGALFKKPVEKDVYTFDDIFEMSFDNKNYILNKVLGQKFFIVENEYPFVCDPYDVTEYDKFFEKSARKSLTTLNSHLLLNSGNIVDNSIYLCLAEDVLSYVDQKGLSVETTIKIYYPALYNKNINSIDDLDDKRVTLVENTKKLLDKKTFTAFKTIDMFYDVFMLKTTELNYVTKGIKYIKAVLRPDFSIKIPLEIIFKIIHATQNSPLIKYNPSARQENVYRLFTDKLATDGRKIPLLKKTTIFKLIKTIARNKSVAVYIESESADTTDSVICEFDEEGFITVSSEFKTVVKIDEIDTIFKATINPIISQIKGFLEQSGYKLNLFASLNDANVEIKQLTYETQIKINKPLDIDAYKGCLSSVFINETNTFKDGKINLRFKRVSNYSKFNSIEAFILEKADQGFRGDQIIESLLENFPEELDREQAVEMVRKIANELEVERGVRKSDIKIKNSPGFKTEISLDKESGVITITTENINNINYLRTIPIYLDTMVRLTQDKKSTKYPTKEINDLCAAGAKGEIMVEDIISPVEESVSKSVVPSLDSDDEEVHYTKFKTVDVNKPKGALSLFYDDDDDDQIDSYEGGQRASESSISSDIESTKEEPAAPSQKLNMSSDSSEESLPSEEAKSVEQAKSDEESIPSEKSISSEEEAKSEEKSIPSEDVKPDEESKSSEKSVEDVKPVEEAVEESMPSEKSVETAKPSAKPDLEAKSDYAEEPIAPEKEEEKDAKSDSESESESESEDVVRNIDGMKLNKPYYFQTLIEKKDPILILKEDTPQFNSYPRTCSSNMRRQPVILTDSQLAKINKDHPKFLRPEDVIKYGSDEKHQFNYICPRFWCLKNNTFVDPNDLTEVIGEDGKKELVHPTCGKVLPRGEKQVKPGYYVYEFYTPKPGKKDYKKYPGLIPDSHPKDLCVPCCFEKYNTEGRIKENSKCLDKKTKEPAPKIAANKAEDEYIKGPDKFPLDPGRWGYLPPEIQTMLHEVNADCQISKTNTNLKEDHPCLLRHGVEVNNKQSFLACISDAIFFGKRVINEKDNTKNETRILSIKEFRQRILRAINIDSFTKYQNGNLVIDFYDPEKKVDVDKYTNTMLFSRLDMNKPEDKAYYSKVISAYENFNSFLSDDDIIIDHTYLWDIISMPNKYLFPTGVNLVIFQIPKDDITNNVSLLCPTNHYSSEFYQARKPTIILMKEDGYYEPIYSYTTHNNKISIIKEFKEMDPTLSKTMRSVFKEIIKPFFNAVCRPLDSMPNVYKSKRAPILYDLVQKLDKYEYTIKKYVLNFGNKVIGVIAEEPPPTERSGFVPCYPSSLEDIKRDVDVVFMTDLTLWNTYTTTVQFLNKLSKRSGKRRENPDIPCKPAFKVIEDEHVVGILTDTNQFIQLSQPIRPDEIESGLDIPSIDNDNYIVNVKSTPMVASEVEITTQKDVDTERVEYIKKIRLETSFYNVFRNTIRILVNNYENAKVRLKIEEELAKEYIIYSEKLKSVIGLLRELVKDKIQFTGDDNFYKQIDNVSACVVKDASACSDTPNLCVTENDSCNLILPNKNIITNNANEANYYARMADEVIRYSRIKSFVFQPKSYLSFGNVGYNLKDDEIILIQPLLTQYFDLLTPAVTNKYIQYISYDEANPRLTQVYENIIPSLDHAIVGRDNKQICEKVTKSHISSSIWKKCFPSDYSEIEYSKTIPCSFTIIIDLIESKTGSKLSVNDIKNVLFEEYKIHLTRHHDKIVDILSIEGKKTLGDQVHAQTLSFASFIYTDNYFLTTLDLWLLVLKYKIPTIFICQKWILQTKYEMHEFVGYGDVEDKFAFILLPGFRPQNIPVYRLVQSETKDIFIPINKLNDECLERVRTAINNKLSISEYLETFEKPTKTNYDRRKQAGLIIDDTPDEQPKRKTKLIIESDSPISAEEVLVPAKKKRTRKKVLVRGGNKKTAKNKAK
jgi:hypothetical protein